MARNLPWRQAFFTQSSLRAMSYCALLQNCALLHIVHFSKIRTTASKSHQSLALRPPCRPLLAVPVHSPFSPSPVNILLTIYQSRQPKAGLVDKAFVMILMSLQQPLTT